jgi:glycogen operon protein
MLAINALRARLKRSLLATLILSQGTPMLLGGDELGRSQQGNNNAYCQDNDVSWYQWQDADVSLISFTAQLISLRRRYPQLRRTRWLTGYPTPMGGKDIMWLNREGTEMTQAQWEEPGRHAFGSCSGPTVRKTRRCSYSLNAEARTGRSPLPGNWRMMIDAHPRFADPRTERHSHPRKARSLVMFEKSAPQC